MNKQARIFNLDHNNINNKQTSSIKSDYFQFKLSDLIDPKKSYLFDNVYAKLEPNSNKLNLIYLQQKQSIKHVPDTYFQLAAKLLNYNSTSFSSSHSNNNNSSNLIMNDFYFLASKQQQISKFFYLLFTLLLLFFFTFCQYLFIYVTGSLSNTKISVFIFLFYLSNNYVYLKKNFHNNSYKHYYYYTN